MPAPPKSDVDTMLIQFGEAIKQTDYYRLLLCQLYSTTKNEVSIPRCILDAVPEIEARMRKFCEFVETLDVDGKYRGVSL